ncbi:MAG: peptidoglycan editing factor PgeF [Paludibacterium sp.]|uniref:peptidoglycan editing factor PgeF n=1 Tax=Paludibacterium sp. TaxID=1917523 RepID=UPI0025E0182E|nr:peptidoglycan editing factor PgeF [Paludibacterium sp.]MBV8045901.1 peptidoglycan editing factor PgeF [Paludibacterium sp.]MBV8646438.1 peptidoglycan editing factor PgeF [Paludibacterium sp.]
MSETEALTADWPAPARVRTLITTRRGGVSPAPFASLNLGDHVGDTPENVAANRALVRQRLPAEPAWLVQTHSILTVAAETVRAPTEADASFTRQADTVCVVMTADCLPVLLCDRQGTVVGAAHAGWRGLCNGVIETLAQAMATPGEQLMAWLGPAIGPDAFEVGAEVRAAFMAIDPRAAQAFTEIDRDKYLADIYLLARQRLNRLGVEEIHGGDRCTVIERGQFFSYRRDGRTGRMGSMIWLADDSAM